MASCATNSAPLVASSAGDDQATMGDRCQMQESILGDICHPEPLGPRMALHARLNFGSDNALYLNHSRLQKQNANETIPEQ
jgi:hypothetical protein